MWGNISVAEVVNIVLDVEIEGLNNDIFYKKLTPRECFNLQGFPKDYQLPTELCNSALYKQAGNSVVVTVIHRIAERIAKAL